MNWIELNILFYFYIVWFHENETKVLLSSQIVAEKKKSRLARRRESDGRANESFQIIP